MILKAVYENCAHLRLPTLRALAHASHDHLMRTRELEDWAARAGVDIGEAAAAAVADGVSRSGAGGMARTRVIGRDQSQTLVELLLFVLETFGRFFLGMAAFNGDASFNGNGEWVGGEFAVPPAAADGTSANGFGKGDSDWTGAQNSPTGFADHGTEQQQQMQFLLQAGMIAGGEGPEGSVDGSIEASFDPSLDAAAAAASQCRSPTPTPYEPPPPAAVEQVAHLGSASPDRSPNGTCHASPRKQGGSVESRSPDGGGPGGGVAPTGGAASPGGDPAVASSPVWPSPGKRSPPSGRPSEDQGGSGDHYEPPWSPAWATAGVRSLEDNPSEAGWPARTLRGNEGDGDGSAVDGPADGSVSATPAPAAADTAAQQPFESAGVVRAGGLGSDEWPTVEESATPEKKTAVERARQAEDERPSATGAGAGGDRRLALPGAQGGRSLPQQPLRDSGHRPRCCCSGGCWGGGPPGAQGGRWRT
ncbi:unnamed protein product [Scytosiphon promiscuus]